MAITVQLKYSDTPGKVPVLGDLVLGELGLNSYDGKLFAKKKQGATEVIIELGKVFVDASAQDVINVSNNNVFSPGSDANKLVFWDHSQSKLSYLALGAGLSVSGGFLTALGETNLSYDATSNTVLSSTGTGAVIPVATVSLSGLQSFSDKTKLDGIEPGATANSTDSQLRDRATHTGTQGFSTVSSVTKGSLLGRYSAGTGPAELISVGYGLTLDGGEILNSLDYQSLVAPTGFQVTGSGTESITISFSPGYSLPTTNSQTNWDIAYNQRLQWDGGSTNLNVGSAFVSLGLGSAATKNVGTSAGTVASGDDGRFVTNLGYTALTRVLTSSTGSGVTLPLATTSAPGLLSYSDKTKLDGLATVASTGSYSDLTGKPSLGSAASLDSGTSPGNVPVLDGSGKLASSTLPSYVDDVVEVANFAALPLTGEAGKIYVTLDNNKTYRWGGSSYVEISASPGSTDAVPEGTTNLYFTSARASAAAPVQSVAGRTGAVTLSVSDVSGALSSADAALTYQPLDSDLTSIAALSTTTFGRSLLTQADQSATLTTIGAAPSIHGHSVFTSSSSGYVPASGGGTTNFLRADGTFAAPPSGSGTVTSVGLSLPSILNVSNSPVTSSGTLTATLAAQGANQVFAGPSSGPASTPTFRQLGYSELSGTDGSITDAKITTAGLSASSVNWTSITAWAPNTSYTKGDLVEYQGIAYRRISTGFSDPSFNGTNWNQTTSSAVISHGHSTFTSTSSGYVPASGGGTTKFLRADGTFAAPPTTFAGYASGNWIQPLPGTVAAGQANVASSVVFYPFTVNRTITVSDLGARVTSPGTNFGLAIYGSANGLPTGAALASTASLAGGVTTTVSGSIGTVTLTAGQLYWGAFNCDAAITMQHLSSGNSTFNTLVGTDTLSQASGTSTIVSWTRTASGTYSLGTWPDMTSVSTTVNSGLTTLRGALIYLRISSLL
jgi:hypothetical protein